MITRAVKIPRPSGKEALARRCTGRARDRRPRRSHSRPPSTSLKAGDVLVIAGKGHESGQTIGNVVRSFLDKDEAVKAAVLLGGKAAQI